MGASRSRHSLVQFAAAPGLPGAWLLSVISSEGKESLLCFVGYQPVVLCVWGRSYRYFWQLTLYFIWFNLPPLGAWGLNSLEPGTWGLRAAYPAANGITFLSVGPIALGPSLCTVPLPPGRMFSYKPRWTLVQINF